MSDKALSKIALGRLRVQREFPYLQHILLALRPVEMKGLGTVGVTKNLLLLYDPTFVEPWDSERAAFILAHEIMHPMLGHHRGEGKIWNMAGDIAINQILREAGLKAPEDALMPETFGFERNLTTEEYYDLLLKKQQEQESKGGESGEGEQGDGDVTEGRCGSCAGNALDNEPDDSEYDGGRSEAEVESLRRVTADAVKSHASKSRGSVPAALARWAEAQLGPPKIRWQAKLARITRRAVSFRQGAVDLCYSRSSRRQAAVGYGRGRPIMPAYRTPIPRVAFVLDTSGSMGTNEIANSLAEVNAILKSVGAAVDFIACDAAVHSLVPVSTMRDLKQHIKGGGGTDFRPAFEALSRQRNVPEIVIFATDGYGPAPRVQPRGMHTIWLLLGQNAQKPASWGDEVRIDDY